MANGRASEWVIIKINTDTLQYRMQQCSSAVLDMANANADLGCFLWLMDAADAADAKAATGRLMLTISSSSISRIQQQQQQQQQLSV